MACALRTSRYSSVPTAAGINRIPMFSVRNAALCRIWRSFRTPDSSKISSRIRLITLAGIVMGSSTAMPSPTMQIRNRIPNSKIRFKTVYLHLKKTEISLANPVPKVNVRMSEKLEKFRDILQQRDGFCHSRRRICEVVKPPGSTERKSGRGTLPAPHCRFEPFSRTVPGSRPESAVPPPRPADPSGGCGPDPGRKWHWPQERRRFPP